MPRAVNLLKEEEGEREREREEREAEKQRGRGRKGSREKLGLESLDWRRRRSEEVGVGAAGTQSAVSLSALSERLHFPRRHKRF